jgi:hypothetical protein
MTKIEALIVKTVAEYHDLPEDLAARMVRSVLENGPNSVYFDLVAPSAMTVINPLWGMVKKTIDAWAPLLADVTPEPPPRRKCAAAEHNGTLENRPGDRVMICPMGGNATNLPITCAWCGQTSITPEQP